MYNFGVLSFWSFNTKFKVILKMHISRNCPLFQFESLIQNLFGILKSGQNESCRAHQSEQLLFGNFSSCWEKSKVILEFLSCPNSNWNFPQIGIWISNCFAQIHPLPLKISSGSLNKFCRVQNSEGLLFWPKFDFYSKFWSNLKKIRKGEIIMATLPEERGCTAATADNAASYPTTQLLACLR